MKIELVKDSYLGGFAKGGDPRTYYPQLWDAIIKDFDIKSIIDVGCGEGHSSKYFANKGLEVLAIDGSRRVLETAVYNPIIIHDYIKGSFIPNKIYDAVWCCEFVEHIDKDYANNFIETFKKAKMIFMTHAFPGQHGHHHVNEQPPEYWINRLEENGFKLLAKTSIIYRAKAHEYFKQSGMIFINKLTDII